MRERVTEWRVLRKDTVCSVAKHMNSEAPVQQFSKSVPCTRLGLMLIFFEDFCCFVYCQMDVLFFLHLHDCAFHISTKCEGGKRNRKEWSIALRKKKGFCLHKTQNVICNRGRRCVDSLSSRGVFPLLPNN